MSMTFFSDGKTKSALPLYFRGQRRVRWPEEDPDWSPRDVFDVALHLIQTVVNGDGGSRQMGGLA